MGEGTNTLIIFIWKISVFCFFVEDSVFLFFFVCVWKNYEVIVLPCFQHSFLCSFLFFSFFLFFFFFFFFFFFLFSFLFFSFLFQRPSAPVFNTAAQQVFI